jgi:hypothetical protein
LPMRQQMGSLPAILPGHPSFCMTVCPTENTEIRIFDDEVDQTYAIVSGCKFVMIFALHFSSITNASYENITALPETS